jgi:hypothetical protein
VLLFLSADELGSLHERISLWSRSVGLGTWSLLLPLGAVLAAVLGRAFALLWSAGGEQRRRLWPLAVGVLLVGSVALQEFIEHSIQWQTDLARAVRGAVEEGTELLGMLVLLRTALANTAGLAVHGTAGDRSAFAALYELRRPLTMFGLALAPMLGIASAAIVDFWGRPADWLASLALFAAALTACRSVFRSGSGLGWPALGLAGFYCLASVTTVSVSAVKLADLGSVEVNLRMLMLGVISILIFVTSLFHLSSGWRALPLGVLALDLLATAWLLPANLTLIYLLPQLLGLVAYWINTTAAPKVGAKSILSPHRGRDEP